MTCLCGTCSDIEGGGGSQWSREASFIMKEIPIKMSNISLLVLVTAMLVTARRHKFHTRSNLAQVTRARGGSRFDSREKQ